MPETSLRQAVFDYVKEKYKSEIESLWYRYPNYAVFRHDDNKKVLHVFLWDADTSSAPTGHHRGSADPTSLKTIHRIVFRALSPPQVGGNPEDSRSLCDFPIHSAGLNRKPEAGTQGSFAIGKAGSAESRTADHRFVESMAAPQRD